jgi:hypothetical protein
MEKQTEYESDLNTSIHVTKEQWQEVLEELDYIKDIYYETSLSKETAAKKEIEVNFLRENLEEAKIELNLLLNKINKKTKRRLFFLNLFLICFFLGAFTFLGSSVDENRLTDILDPNPISETALTEEIYEPVIITEIIEEQEIIYADSSNEIIENIDFSNEYYTINHNLIGDITPGELIGSVFFNDQNKTIKVFEGVPISDKAFFAHYPTTGKGMHNSFVLSASREPEVGALSFYQDISRDQVVTYIDTYGSKVYEYKVFGKFELSIEDATELLAPAEQPSLILITSTDSNDENLRAIIDLRLVSIRNLETSE